MGDHELSDMFDHTKGEFLLLSCHIKVEWPASVVPEGKVSSVADVRPALRVIWPGAFNERSVLIITIVPDAGSVGPVGLLSADAALSFEGNITSSAVEDEITGNSSNHFSVITRDRRIYLHNRIHLVKANQARDDDTVSDSIHRLIEAFVDEQSTFIRSCTNNEWETGDITTLRNDHRSSSKRRTFRDKMIGGGRKEAGEHCWTESQERRQRSRMETHIVMLSLLGIENAVNILGTEALEFIRGVGTAATKILAGKVGDLLEFVRGANGQREWVTDCECSVEVAITLSLYI